MTGTFDRLRHLRVADVMTKQVVQISRSETLTTAAATLLRHEISGAPVTDEGGTCVGMLSATDFMRSEVARSHPAAQAPLRGKNRHVRHENVDETFPIAPEFPDLVGYHMSPGVHSVGVEDSLLKVGQAMCVSHVHRLPVLDQNGHLLGMVTSFDLVAALVQAMEEAQSAGITKRQ